MRRNIVVGLGLALSLAGTAGIAAAQQGEPARPERGTEHGKRGSARPQGDTQQNERGAQERGRGMRGPGMRGRGGPDGLLLKGITLTGEQRSQIAQLRKTQRHDMNETRERGTPNPQRDAMRAARERGDTAAMRDIMRKNRETMAQERTQHIAAIRNILTAEQRVQFDKNVAELQARSQERGRERGRS